MFIEDKKDIKNKNIKKNIEQGVAGLEKWELLFVSLQNSSNFLDKLSSSRPRMRSGIGHYNKRFLSIPLVYKEHLQRLFYYLIFHEQKALF